MSYSTAASLYDRIGPRIALQLTTEAGSGDSTPDDAVTEPILDKAMKEIDVRIGHRTNPVSIALLANLEERIAYWFLWVRRGFSETETAAAAAREGYDAAIRLLEGGNLDLPAETPADPTDTTGTGWASLTPVFTKTNFRGF